MTIRCAAILLAAAVLANAATRSEMRITILDSETHSANVQGGDVPKNCDDVNFDAYCNNSKSVELTNTLVVQEGNNPPFKVSCNIETKWSKCVPLPKGESFDARREKRGLVVYYVDDKGKVRGQLYTFVGGEPKSWAAASAPASPAPTMMPQGPTAAQAAASGQRETVKCNFSSTPAGAEVTVDGRYVGSTPSVLGVTTGKHVVTISMAGYEQWKRELEVTTGSELTVNAVLQKTQ
ncbi:MAG: PEGA domain-containing protein [Terriglobales bacterium]